METLEQKKRRLYGKQDMPKYLEELRTILLIQVDQSNLLSIPKTDLIRKNNLAKQLRCTCKILFTDKVKLRRILLSGNYDSTNIENYFLFTSYSKDCGAVQIGSLNNFNFDFQFLSVTAGIITLTREDLCKEVVLDFYEEAEKEYLEVKEYEK